MRVLWISALIACLADQISKYVVIHQMELARVLAIDVWSPFLNFRYGENCGINFGLLKDCSSAWILIALALVICGWLLWWVRRTEMSRLAKICAGFVVGGALGNVIDRSIYGYVLDFLNMSCCGINNPFVFNIADVFIFVGAIGLVLLVPDGKKAA